MMNILNGGAHASSDVDIQEFMVIPTVLTIINQHLEQEQNVIIH